MDDDSGELTTRAGRAGLAEDMTGEKRKVALSSVLAAVFLTALKLVVGLLTGSLGILAEAAHSGLDLAAAGVTYMAVRVSDQPADQRHMYGHGKVENLSALFETLLLLVTCAWIIYEAVQRLFFHPVQVEASIWAFAVMGISILVDLGRSRALGRVAEKYKSQALEADALHFSTDIWSSTVVIVGLIFVRLAAALNAPILEKADAAAALGVAAIVVFVSVQLGRRAVDALLDAAPRGLQERIAEAARVPGVLDVRDVRVRQSGPRTFADLILAVPADTSVELGHSIADRAEASVASLLPDSDIMVHVEPEDHHTTGDVGEIRLIASQHGMSAHALRLFDLGDGRSLELHLEVPGAGRLDEAHKQATAFEADVRQRIPSITSVVTHIEPTGGPHEAPDGGSLDERLVARTLDSLEDELGVRCDFHNVRLHDAGGEITLSLHCHLDPGMDLHAAHEFSEQVEQALRVRMPQLARVIIHVEPAGSSEP
jgi:cation diffusion facilitator family transporter